VSNDRIHQLFFEMFTGLPRQGPGDAASTRRALALVPGVGARTRILDVGCGTGAQTRALALASPAQIVAVDSHAPFVDALTRDAQAAGLADRIDARVGDMGDLDLAPGSFDLVWCEGAIAIIGVEAGLGAWRRLLAPGGHMAVTEVCWLKPDPPAECAAFWAEEYPAIRPIATLLAVVDACGYDAIGHFTLPPGAWWDDYYAPLERNVTTFRERHGDEPDAQALADRVQREIDVWRRYSAFYSYEFVVMRAR
jgi:SAM-dependent methyltransferase